jgi:hypothetical protein
MLLSMVLTIVTMLILRSLRLEMVLVVVRTLIDFKFLKINMLILISVLHFYMVRNHIITLSIVYLFVF